MAQYWIRYQNGDNNHEKHKTAPAEQWDEIRSSAMRVTPLAYSRAEDVTDEPAEDTYAKGDFWLDLDSGDLLQTIDDVKRLIDWLEHNHVDLATCQFFASGSKGFHVCLPSKLMGGKAEKALWLTYRCFAKGLAEKTGISSIDYSLYNYKHLLRTEGKRRSDGKYKVPLTLTEVHAITPASYEDLTSEPRPAVEYNRKVSVTSYTIGAMMEQARKEAALLIEQKKKVKAIPLEALTQFNDTYHPRCIDWIVNGVNLKADAKFNDIAMNLASYLSAASLSEAARTDLVRTLAGKRAAVGDSGRGATERINYIWDKVRFVERGTLQFKCAANKAVIEGDPCEACPVRTACFGEASEGIEAREDGYYSIKGETPRRLSNWVLRPEEKSIRAYLIDTLESKMVVDEREPRYKWDKVEIDIICEGQNVTLTVPQSAFDSTNSFKKEVVRQIDRGVWYGTDVDVQSLKLMLTDPKCMDSVIKVKSAGIHRHVEKGIDTFVYAEPGWSKNTDGITGTHRCVPDGRLNALRFMRHQEPAAPTNPADLEVLHMLLNSNQPHVVGTMLGWVCACHIKMHYRKSGVSGFPLLHPYGAPSSGKTASSMLYAALGCSDYRDSPPPTVGEMTGHPLKVFTTSTTTIPRILDEVNQQMIKTQQRLKEAYSLLRNCYGDQSFQIGALGKEHSGSEIGARTIELFATTPVIFCATQQNARVEIKERMIEINLPKFHSDEHTRNFEYLRQHEVWDRLFGYAKLLLMESLQVSIADIRQWRLDAIKDLPVEFKDRHKDNHAVLLCGFRLLDRALRKGGFPITLINEVESIRQALLAYWFDNLSEYVSRQSETEILKLFKQFARMAAWTDRHGNRGLVPQHHFLLLEHTLYLDLESCYTELEMMFSRMGGRIMEYENTAQIRQLLRDEDYFIGFGPVPGHPTALDWLALDRAKLERKGVNVKSFWG